jgi:hypothetical protein
MLLALPAAAAEEDAPAEETAKSSGGADDIWQRKALLGNLEVRRRLEEFGIKLGVTETS